MSDKLTPKQEKFCLEMSRLGNQYQAYCNSFSTRNMSRGAIDVEASKLMNNPKITLRLRELAEEIKSEAIADAQEIQEYLTKVIRGQVKEECIIQGESIFKKVAPSLSIKACELLAKMRGYYDLKVNVEAPVIIDDIATINEAKIIEVMEKLNSLQG